jgi:hypothetical protein
MQTPRFHLAKMRNQLGFQDSIVLDQPRQLDQ